MCISGSRGSRCRGSIDWFQVCGMAPHSRAPVHCAGPCWELKWRLYFDPLTLLSTEVTYILTLHRAENWSDYIWPCTVLRTEVVSSGGSPGVHLGVIWGVTWGVIWGVTWGVIWGVTWRSSGGHLGVYVCVCVCIYTQDDHFLAPATWPSAAGASAAWASAAWASAAWALEVILIISS